MGTKIQGINMPYLKNKGCGCSLYPSGSELKLMSLLTYKEHRQKGYATDILLAAKKYAKRVGMPILLFVGPFDDQPMNKEQLLRFYNKQGFFFDHDNYGIVFLKYNPNGDKHGQGQTSRYSQATYP